MATILNRQVTFATNGTVTAAGLHNLIDQTEIYAGIITTQDQIASVGSSDQLLIADADETSTSAPRRVTVGSMFNDALNNGIYTTGSFTNRVTAGSFVGNLTGNVTGTIVGTTGTIATLNSTTSTITNLSATTSTFLGTITGSTNVINIGGGQIYKDGSGNVGIGTGGTAAASKLDVYGVGNFQGLEVGKSGQTGNRNAGIDFTGDDTYTDYGFRIIRQNTGANADTYLTNRGTGNVIVESAEAGQVLIKTNSTSRFIVNANGNVGIGTTNPATKLDVYGDGYFQSIEVGKAGQTGNRDALIDFVGDDTYSDYGFRIIRGNTGANANSVLIHRGTGGFFLQATEAGPIIFQTTNTERLRIDGANGTLTSQPTYDNTAAGSAVVVTSAGLIRRTSSSLKYKKDIENLDSSIVDNAIDRLRPVWYRTKNPEGDDKPTWSHVGLIAEEVDSVEPRLVRYKTVEVSTNENGERIETQLENPVPEDVDYARLSVILLSEVKAQRIKIASLEARLEALEAK